MLIPAYDVVMANAIDQKGAILTKISHFWFTLLQQRLPSLHTHLLSVDLPEILKARLAPQLVQQLSPRSMVVRSLQVLPIESIVRGYITGSAWSSYQKNGTVCGIQMPEGLQESEKLDRPLWTPSTKAEHGAKDENISPDEGGLRGLYLPQLTV